MHVFGVDRTWPELSEKSGRDAFAKRYGGSRSRLDDDRKRWTRADRAAYHGGPGLTVAGHALQRGMHWEVISERRKFRLVTANQVWEVPRGAHGYVNVYPDAFVRPGGDSRAQLIWDGPSQRRTRS